MCRQVFVLCACTALLGAVSAAAQVPGIASTGSRRTAQGSTRSADGQPGPGYWQQRVDYDVDARLDPAANTVSGVATIIYHNNSPDTLTQLWWHLYQNTFRARAPATRGMTIESITIDGASVTPQIDLTLMSTPLPAPIAPGSKTSIHVRWSYEIARYTSLRSGRDGNDFALAQWYPQIAVYDDQHGWDTTPYRGTEFYLEYGNWDARLTVPAEYVVAATGSLHNPQDVLTPAQQARLAAVSANGIIAIIPREEGGTVRPVSDSTAAPAPTPVTATMLATARATATRTWRFTAEDVRDFVWAASPHFLWDATRTAPVPDQPQGVIVHAFYKPNQQKHFAAALPIGRHALELFSRRFGSYAYPQATLVSGPARGMEYPMFVFLSPGDPITFQLAAVTVHELGHQWYPMMVGSHETAHAWMDEGFATYLEALALDSYYTAAGILLPEAPAIARAVLPNMNPRELYQHVYLAAARAGADATVMTHSHNLTTGYSIAAYQKPGAMLFMLEDMLGAERMDRALQEYHRRWRFRHPYPEDFFNTVEDVADQDLDWFWNQWLVQQWQLDIALDDVAQTQQASGWNARIRLRNRDRAAMPVLLRLTLADGSVRDVRVPVTAWHRDGVWHTVAIDALPARVTHAELDPDHMLADRNRLNDRWPHARTRIAIKPGPLMDFLAPLDAYSVSIWPSLGGTRVDGRQLGFETTSSYAAEQHRITTLANIGTRSGIVDWRVGYGNTLRTWSPSARWHVEAFRVDGRAGGELEFEWDPAGAHGIGMLFASAAATRPRVSVGVRAIELRDARFLRDRTDWEPGELVAATARARGGVSTRLGVITGGVRLEASAPGTTVWEYGKVFADVRLARRALAGSTLALRIAGGRITGAAPAQTQLYLAQASPWVRFDSGWFRSENNLDRIGIADQLLAPGDGNVVSAALDARGQRLAAVNATLTRGLVELFANTGDVWTYGAVDTHRWSADAGVGLRLGPPGTLGPIDLSRFSAFLRAPLWVRDPAHPERDGFDWRLRIAIGGRWGEQ